MYSLLHSYWGYSLANNDDDNTFTTTKDDQSRLGQGHFVVCWSAGLMSRPIVYIRFILVYLFIRIYSAT